MRVDTETILATVDIASEHDLTSYDAAYVAMARRHGWTLVSADIRDLVSRELAVAPDHPGID
jgi:predicted nucleic acid-binding protein